jgi:hypothetical protein
MRIKTRLLILIIALGAVTLACSKQTCPAYKSSVQSSQIRG